MVMCAIVMADQFHRFGDCPQPLRDQAKIYEVHENTTDTTVAGLWSRRLGAEVNLTMLIERQPTFPEKRCDRLYDIVQQGGRWLCRMLSTVLSPSSPEPTINTCRSSVDDPVSVHALRADSYCVGGKVVLPTRSPVVAQSQQASNNSRRDRIDRRSMAMPKIQTWICNYVDLLYPASEAAVF